ncbi:MAG: HDOD domain-containing protein [bacterium]
MQKNKKKDYPLTIKKLTSSITDLPTFPHIVNNALKMLENPMVSPVQLGKLLSSDQILTSKILKLVNSAFYGFPRSVSTVHHAIVLLGFKAIKDLLITTSIFNVFSHKKNNSFFDRNKFWEHSIGCGIAARIIANNFNYRLSGEIFTYGLVHDIGKIVEDIYLSEEFLKIINIVKAEKISVIEAEKRVLDTTHAEIGSWLVDKWNLPYEFVEVIKYHHDPTLSVDNKDLCIIVYIANMICKINNIGSGGDNYVTLPMDNIIEILKDRKPDIKSLGLEEISCQLREEMKKTEILLQMMD